MKISGGGGGSAAGGAHELPLRAQTVALRPRSTRRRWNEIFTGSVLLLALALLPGRPAAAHAGPPFPILVDHRAGPYVVSVWSDPDIGTGTFFVVLEPPEEGPLPSVTAVRIAVQPASGRLAEAVHDAAPQPVRHGARYFAEVPFDAGGPWRVRVAVSGAAGRGEVATEVEVTPDGTIGPIGLVVYLVPFLAIGFLWLKGALRRKQGPARPSS